MLARKGIHLQDIGHLTAFSGMQREPCSEKSPEQRDVRQPHQRTDRGTNPDFYCHCLPVDAAGSPATLGGHWMRLGHCHPCPWRDLAAAAAAAAAVTSEAAPSRPLRCSCQQEAWGGCMQLAKCRTNTLMP
uniref:Uncharacterized protein n=1 Tax=Rousettus aegyptiacus TaxID=9407 RepID=A0A7J8BS10_ROUAE|nr:hypothetical protein HJG63_009600 [Rousettus aegyptiacus]